MKRKGKTTYEEPRATKNATFTYEQDVKLTSNISMFNML